MHGQKEAYKAVTRTAGRNHLGEVCVGRKMTIEEILDKIWDVNLETWLKWLILGLNDGF